MFWMAGLGKLVATPAIHLSRFFLFFIFFYKCCTAQTQQGKGKPGGRAKKSRWSLGLSEIQTHHLPSVWLHPIVEKKNPTQNLIHINLWFHYLKQALFFSTVCNKPFWDGDMNVTWVLECIWWYQLSLPDHHISWLLTNSWLSQYLQDQYRFNSIQFNFSFHSKHNQSPHLTSSQILITLTLESILTLHPISRLNSSYSSLVSIL